MIFSVRCLECRIAFNASGGNKKRCSECTQRRRLLFGREYKKAAKERGYKRARQPCSADQLRRIRNRRLIAVSRRRLAKINRVLDRIESTLWSHSRDLMRRAWRRANARRLQAELEGRKLRRRRSLDPNANREHKRIAVMVWSVFKAFDYQCAYCGITRMTAKSRGHDLQLDHIIPLTDPLCVYGEANAAPACISCNASKGNRDLMQWAKMKELTPHPLAVAKYLAIRSKRAA